jgi:transposase
VQGISISRVQQLYREYKSTGVIHVQKKVGRHKRPVLENNKNEKLSYKENTELAQVTSAKFSELKDYTSEMKRSTKYSKRLDLQ